MPDKNAPRKISTQSAKTGHTGNTAPMDAERVRRAAQDLVAAHSVDAPPDSKEAGAAQTASELGAQSAKAGPPASEIPKAAPLFAEQPMFYDQFNDPDFPQHGNASPAKPDANGAAARRFEWQDILILVLIVVFGITLLISGGVLIKRYIDDRKTQNNFSALQDLMVEEEPEQHSAALNLEDTSRFTALQERNEECVGWISIDYTDLSYPVMYSPTRPNFYLKHDFDGNYSDYGVPYLDEDCTLTEDNRSNNLIIYGHNMKTGIIFEPLTGYLEGDFYIEHPTIRLETLYDDAEYEVFAAFEIDVVEDPNFVYNEYYDMDAETFDWFVNEVITRSPVKTGIVPAYGEDLITLSTCEYTTDNGRLVVCAHKIDEDTDANT